MGESRIQSVEEELFSNAISLRGKGLLEESIEACWKVLAINKMNGICWIIQGYNYMETSRLVIAISCYQKALTNPKAAHIPLIYYNIAFCILKYTEYFSSIPYFKKAISYGYTGDPNTEDPNLWLWLGEAYMRSHKYEAAIKSLLKGIRTNEVKDKNRLYSFFFRSIESILCSNNLQSRDYLELLSDEIKENMSVKSILCIGDSHVNIFEIVKGFDVVQTGSPTAYNLQNIFSTTGAYELIMQALNNYDPSSTAVMLTYAEIDIRNHIYKQLQMRNISFRSACEEVVEKYMEVINKIHSKGYKIIINGPFGSGIGVPNHGEISERNSIAVLVEECLKKHVSSINAIYTSFLPIAIRPNMSTRREFFGEVDDNHLNKSREIVFYILTDILKLSSRNKISTRARKESKILKELGSNSAYAFIDDKKMDARYGLLDENGLLTDASPLKYDTLIIKLPSSYILKKVELYLHSESHSEISCLTKDQFFNELSIIKLSKDYLCLNKMYCQVKQEPSKSSSWPAFIQFKSSSKMTPISVERIQVKAEYIEFNEVVI